MKNETFKPLRHRKGHQSPNRFVPASGPQQARAYAAKARRGAWGQSPQIQKYESGTDGLSAAKVLRLTEILGVNVSHFYHAPVRADLDD